MSKNRIKVKRMESGPESREEMEAMMGEVRALTIEKNVRSLALESELKAATERHAAGLLLVEDKLGRRVELLRDWAEWNREAEFKGRQTIETRHGELGWRVGQPTLKPLAGWNWKRVLAKLEELAAFWEYVRRKPEVDREGLLRDRKSLELAAVGCKVVQEEGFFVEPKVEQPENRLEAEGRGT